MGTKFANIHIHSNEVDSIKEALSLWYADENQNRKQMFQDLNIPFKISQLIGDTLENCYIGNFKKGWYTVLHTNFDWESINNSALVISKYLSAPILTISYFDDDIFTLSVIKEGKIYAEHISGNSLEIYDLEETVGDAKLMIEELGLDISPDVLDGILRLDDLEDKVMELENLFELPLWVNADWIEEEEIDDEFNDKWEKYNFSKENK